MPLKFCLYCPDDCQIEGEHHHLPGEKYDQHPGKRLPSTLGGLTDDERE